MKVNATFTHLPSQHNTLILSKPQHIHIGHNIAIWAYVIFLYTAISTVFEETLLEYDTKSNRTKFKCLYLDCQQ